MWRGTVFAGRGRRFQPGTLIVLLMYKMRNDGRKDTHLHIRSVTADVLTKFSCREHRVLCDLAERRDLEKKGPNSLQSASSPL